MPRDLFLLAQHCHTQARVIGELLRKSITREALALSAQGFVVPSAESLDNAAKVFDSVQAMPGENAAMGAMAHTPKQRLDLICALATSLQGLENALDLSWSSIWSIAHQFEGPVSDLLAIEVLAQWNAGKGRELLEEMIIACTGHEKKETWER